MKKKGIILGALIIAMITGMGQDRKPVEEEYSRSAVTLMLLDYNGGKYRQQLRREFEKHGVPEKFDANSIGKKIIATNLAEGAGNADKIRTLISQLNQKRIGNAIIAKWFNRQEDGTMNMDIIHERGLYNAVDTDVRKAEASKRGRAMLMDMGLDLLSKTYIVVVDFDRIRSADDLKINDQHGWQSGLNVFLFRVKYNSDVQAELFNEMWIYNDDDSETKETKKAKFESFTFEVEYVATESNPIPLRRMQYNSDTQIGQFLPQKSNEELFVEFVDKGHQRAFFLLEQKYEDFRVKIPLYERRPLKAKVGKKEGLRVDHRYFVYEYIYNEKTNESEPKRKGVVRAKKVVDNRKMATGESKASRFYQITGGKLQKGMLLQQRMDWGIGLQGRFGIGEIGGVGLKASYNTGTIIGIPQLKLYGYFANQNKSYRINKDLQDVNFLRLGGGLSKGYYFARRFSIEPFIGGAMETGTASNLTYDDLNNLGVAVPSESEGTDSFSASVIMFDFGIDLGMHVTYWMKLMAGVEYHSCISNAYDDDGNDIVFSGVGSEYDNIFDGRQGYTINLGLYLEF
ncbi:MAG: hypothetical protein PF489_03140 [Salinivirgaceae bacterium]|jgi:hypothetical protein|nr:hypothetical protein [Salinivirgaceae bacterium]